MRGKDRWTSHRDERRRQFVDAALRVLDAVGPELPMDAVAAEAGVSKPVLYRYFSDKAALVEALAERGSEILLARLLPGDQLVRAGARPHFRRGRRVLRGDR